MSAETLVGYDKDDLATPYMTRKIIKESSPYRQTYNGQSFLKINQDMIQVIESTKQIS